MARLSEHALDRLQKTRFALSANEIKTLSKQVDNRNGHKIIRKRQPEIRQVSINGKKIHLVLNDKDLVITALPPTMIQDDESKKQESLYRQISSMQLPYERYNLLMMSGLFRSICELIRLRRMTK